MKTPVTGIPSPLVDGSFPLKFNQNANASDTIVAVSGPGTATLVLRYTNAGGALVALVDGLLTVGEQYQIQAGNLPLNLLVTTVVGDVFVDISNKD